MPKVTPPSQRLASDEYLKIPQRHADVLRLASEGTPTTTIAKITGLSHSSVWRIVHNRMSQGAIIQLQSRQLDRLSDVREQFEDMADSAADAIHEIISDKDSPSLRLKAASFALGVIGLSPVQRSEAVNLNLGGSLDGETLDAVRSRLTAATSEAARSAAIPPHLDAETVECTPLPAPAPTAPPAPVLEPEPPAPFRSPFESVPEQDLAEALRILEEYEDATRPPENLIDLASARRTA